MMPLDGGYQGAQQVMKDHRTLGGPTPHNPAQPMTISSVLDGCHGLVEVTARKLSELEDRLSTVTRGAGPETTPKGPPAAQMPFQGGVGMSLVGLAEKLDNLNHRLESTTNRLEL